MIDTCKHCTARGDLSLCLATNCSTHESWFAGQQAERITELEAENERLRELLATARAEVSEFREVNAYLNMRLAEAFREMFRVLEPVPFHDDDQRAQAKQGEG